MSGPSPLPVDQELRLAGGATARSFFDLYYPELRRIAANRMRGERADHTWQPTALVNELYLELVKAKALPAQGDDAEAQRAALFGLVGFWMKRMLIHHSRPLYRRAEKVSLDSIQELPTFPARPSQDTLTDLERLLSRLAGIDPKLRLVVELRVFEGKTGDEIANEMGCTRRTVTSYWNFARQWLVEQIGER